MTDDDDFVFQTPFTLTLAGPTQCGKSSFLFSLIKFSKKRYSCKPGKFFFFYSVWQDLYDKIAKLNYDITWMPGTPNADFIHENVQAGRNDTLTLRFQIFDDLASGLDKNTVEIYNVLSHHLKANVAFVVHNLYDRNPLFRQISLNSKYLVIYKNPRDSSTIFHFAKQFSPESPRRTVDIYRFATRRKCTYLFVDLSQSCPDESRLMSNIFYEDNQDFLTFKNT